MGHLEVRVGGSRAGVRSRTSTMSEHLVRAYADGRLGLEPSRSSTICTREAGSRERTRDKTSVAREVWVTEGRLADRPGRIALYA